MSGLGDWQDRADIHWGHAQRLVVEAERYLTKPNAPDTARCRAATALAAVHAQLSEQAAARSYLTYSAADAVLHRIRQLRRPDAPVDPHECTCCVANHRPVVTSGIDRQHQHTASPCALHPDIPFFDDLEAE